MLKKNKVKLKRMTYILGAKCSDGVVIIADRKVSGQLVKERYSDKIKAVPNFPSMIFSAAGIQDLFEQFLQELPRRVYRSAAYLEAQNKEMPEQARYEYGVYNFKVDCVNLLNEMSEIYKNLPDDETSLQVMFVMKEQGTNNLPTSTLYYLDWGTKYPIPVETYMPIGQGHLGKIFLKAFKPEMNMVECAKLGAFIIRYIEKEDLSDGESIGCGDKLPQIWLCPNKGEFKELKGNELQQIYSGVEGKVSEISKTIGISSKLFRL